MKMSQTTQSPASHEGAGECPHCGRSPARAGASRPAFWRVFEIHKIIQAGRFPNCTTLAREIEKTVKTIQRDISFMRDQLGLPLEFDAVKNGYFYTRPVEDFPLLHLSRKDLMALFLARHALEPLRGTKLERMLGESFSKIAEACPGQVSMAWGEFDEAFSVKAAGVVPADVTLFGDLLDAVRARRVVEFDYHKLTGAGPERRQVRPYHLGQIEHGWYLVGHDVGRQGWRTFALQRMTSLEVQAERFQRDRAFDVQDHLGGGFGVWSYADERGTPLHEVRIRLDGYAARVVAERRWHPTQEILPLKEDGSEVEFRARLAGLEEITRWVLSWGARARVLGPPELAERVRWEARGMLGLATE